MVIALIPVVVLVIGLLMWALSGHPVVSRAGMIWFAVGSFFTVWVLARTVLKLP